MAAGPDHCLPGSLGTPSLGLFRKTVGSGRAELIRQHAQRIRCDGEWLELADLFLYTAERGIQMLLVHNRPGDLEVQAAADFVHAVCPTIPVDVLKSTAEREWTFVLTSASFEPLADPRAANHWCPAYRCNAVADPEEMIDQALTRFSCQLTDLQACLAREADQEVRGTLKLDLQYMRMAQARYMLFVDKLRAMGFLCTTSIPTVTAVL